jgi:hypothetical protein
MPTVKTRVDWRSHCQKNVSKNPETFGKIDGYLTLPKPCINFLFFKIDTFKFGNITNKVYSQKT